MDREEREQANPDDLDLNIGPNGSEQIDGADGLRQVDEELAARPRRLNGAPPGPGTELACYWVSSGERLLICAIGKGGLEIHDVPADFLGETYRVDRALESDTALWAVVDDYLAQARRLDAPPMCREAISALILGGDR